MTANNVNQGFNFFVESNSLGRNKLHLYGRLLSYMIFPTVFSRAKTINRSS